MAFVKDERVTHISARDVRTNGTVAEVHDDDRTNIYYSVLLDSGREVQTIESRLRKGEYTGVGRWQRVLDARTGCYFFFDEERSQTLWDTPEARDTIFGNSESSHSALNTSVISERTSRLASPSKNVSFSTEPPSVVYFSTEHENERSYSSSDPDSSENLVSLRPIPQPQTRTLRGRSNLAASAPSAPLPVSSGSISKEARARAIAESWELRKALAMTGAASIAGNLRVLGIPVNESAVDETKLPEMLATALAKISLTIETSDLNLLLRHVMGDPKYHDLADKLSAPGTLNRETSDRKADRVDYSQRNNGYEEVKLTGSEEFRATGRSMDSEQPRTTRNISPIRVPLPGMTAPLSPAISSRDERRLSREGAGSMEMKGGSSPSSVQRIPVPFSEATPYREEEATHGPLNLGRTIGSTSEAPRSFPGSGVNDISRQRRELSYVVDGSANISRQSQESYGEYSTDDSRFYSAHSNSSFENTSSFRSERDRPYETAIVRDGEEIVTEKSPPRVLFEVRSQDAYKDSSQPSRPRPWSATLPPPKTVASPQGIKRRADLWANMPPPSRPPPSGPPSYDRYRPNSHLSSSTSRIRSDGSRSTSMFIPDSRFLPQDLQTRRVDQSLDESLRKEVNDGDQLALPSTIPGERREGSFRSSPQRPVSGSGIRQTEEYGAAGRMSPTRGKPLETEAYNRDSGRSSPVRARLSGRFDDDHDGRSSPLRAVSSEWSSRNERDGLSSSPTRTSSTRPTENVDDIPPSIMRSSSSNREIDFSASPDEVATLRYQGSKQQQPPPEFAETSDSENEFTQPSSRIPKGAHTRDNNDSVDDDNDFDRSIEDDVKRTEAIRADLSDLNLNLNQLLEHMTSASERIDATWKDEDAAEVQVSAPKPQEAPTPIRTAPPPSAVCGPSSCVIS